MTRYFLAFAIILAALSASQAQSPDEKTLEALQFRSIGPAGMSGRITAIDVVRSEPDHIIAGAASGGVWESRDGGVTWVPIFDEQPTLSIGAIRINPSNPSEIWVGTGEGNPRNTQNSGKGIFRTLDGGRTWKCMGLEDTRTIHRILVDPQDGRTVYVGAMGSAWGPGEQRGVFKTTDGGKTWSKVLYVNERTGAADLVMDPANPRKLIAAMYEYARTPWDYVSGGKGSGIHVTYDGGESWKRITSEEGLPKGDLGRIGLAIAASEPEIVYALVEAKENGLYKSVDGGLTWSLVSTKNIGNRPFYYHEIYVDPKREDRIWNLYSYVSKSDDGGRTFETILDYGKGVHPDHHAFYIHPDDPDYILEGNDGGLYISRDGGKNWRFCSNIPVGQFYHVNVDQEFPYNLYGGMQDNGSWVGPAFVLKSGGIRNNDWRELYFGDGFDVLPRSTDSRYGWAMSQGGNLAYYDRETGFNQFVKPVHPDGLELRFNWNAALAAVPGADCGIYYGSQFVHKSVDCGRSWEIISPDLTTNDTTKQKQGQSGGLTIDATNAENHTTILAIAPSPVDPTVIWVGTDDGNLQLTRDGGRSWVNLADRLPGCPGGAWIPQIEASRFGAGEAFVVVNHYRRDDWRPFLYHTTDFGATWRNLAGRNEPGSRITSFVQSVAQDPVESRLLFLGADDGLYISTDKGGTWSHVPGKVFPHVPVMDMKVHPADHSLAIATFGRALWVLDNLLPLRRLTRDAGALDKSFLLFPAPDGVQAQYRSVDGIRFAADSEFKGDNRSPGIRWPVYVKPMEKASTVAPAEEQPDNGPEAKTVRKKKKDEKGGDPAMVDPKGAGKKDAPDADPGKGKGKGNEKDKNLLKLYVFDATGDTVRYLSAKMKEGWNTIGWDMRARGVRYLSRRESPRDADDPSGVLVAPGRYKVLALYGESRDSLEVVVGLDPRLPVTPSDLAARNAALTELSHEVSRARQAFMALQDVRKDLRTVEAMMVNGPDTVQDAIRERQKELTRKLGELEELFMEPEDVKGYTRATHISSELGAASSYLNTSLGAPGPNALHKLNHVRSRISDAVVAVNEFLDKDWTLFRDYVQAQALPVFREIKKAE